MNDDKPVCNWCAVDSTKDESVQLRECGHVLCDKCAKCCYACLEADMQM